ncbi:unnamed protein product, partial [Meganyctiphanes norvegica]
FSSPGQRWSRPISLALVCKYFLPRGRAICSQWEGLLPRGGISSPFAILISFSISVMSGRYASRKSVYSSLGTKSVFRRPMICRSGCRAKVLFGVASNWWILRSRHFSSDESSSVVEVAELKSWYSTKLASFT